MYHNGKVLTHPINLADTDKLDISHYSIFFSQGAYRPGWEGAAESSAIREGAGIARDRSWTSTRIAENLPFGKVRSDDDAEEHFSTHHTDRPSSIRHAFPEPGNEESDYSALEERIILTVGLLLLLAFLGAAIWWLAR